MKPRKELGATGFLLLGIALTLLIWAAHLDAEDAARDDAVYCQMVSDGYWPDYRGDFEKVCP